MPLEKKSPISLFPSWLINSCSWPFQWMRATLSWKSSLQNYTSKQIVYWPQDGRRVAFGSDSASHTAVGLFITTKYGTRNSIVLLSKKERMKYLKHVFYEILLLDSHILVPFTLLRTKLLNKMSESSTSHYTVTIISTFVLASFTFPGI